MKSKRKFKDPLYVIVYNKIESSKSCISKLKLETNISSKIIIEQELLNIEIFKKELKTIEERLKTELAKKLNGRLVRKKKKKMKSLEEKELEKKNLNEEKVKIFKDSMGGNRNSITSNNSIWSVKKK